MLDCHCHCHCDPTQKLLVEAPERWIINTLIPHHICFLHHWIKEQACFQTTKRDTRRRETFLDAIEKQEEQRFSRYYLIIWGSLQTRRRQFNYTRNLDNSAMFTVQVQYQKLVVSYGNEATHNIIDI